MKTIKHVVLIDDNKIDCIVNKKLIELNFDDALTTVFNSPELALKFFEEISDDDSISNTDIDLVLVDVNMPHMSGFQFLDKLSLLIGNQQKPFDLFFLSSSSNHEDVDRSKTMHNCSGYVLKPLNNFKLKKIQELNKLHNGIIR